VFILIFLGTATFILLGGNALRFFLSAIGGFWADERSGKYWIAVYSASLFRIFVKFFIDFTNISFSLFNFVSFVKL